MKQYLKNLCAKDFGFIKQTFEQLEEWHPAYAEVKHLMLPDIYFVSDYREERATRIVGTHKNLTGQYKRQVFQLIELFDRRATIRKAWESHHIVEGQDFADLDLTGSLPALYQDGLPCVLIHKHEHDAYSFMLRDEKTRSHLFTPYRPALLERFPSKTDRARHTASLGRQVLQLPLGQRHTNKTAQHLLERVEGLEQIYRSVYKGDHVLYQIAMNVFEEVRSLIQ